MIPVLVKDIIPAAPLARFVRKFQVFRFVFDRHTQPPPKLHLPRPEHCITFYTREPQRFSYTNSTAVHAYPACTINGMYTEPVYRYGGYDFMAIKAILQPSVLYHLVKMPAGFLTNAYMDAADIWKDVRYTNEALQEIDELPAMIRCIEQFLLQRCSGMQIPPHPIDAAPAYLLEEDREVSLEQLARSTYLSTRQFIRKFEERTGVACKTFQRIARMDKAYRMKNRYPGHDWLRIAVGSGYFDYQHLARDFKAFTRLTPPQLYAIELKAPERCFGFAYQT